MQMLLGRLGGPYCHANACSLRPFSKGEMLSVFSFCVFFVSGSLSFVVFLSFLLSKGRFLEKFSGANFCFWEFGSSLCFLVGFCYVFCFIFWRFAPGTVWKNSLDVRSGFFLGSFSLALVFVVVVVFFFRDKDQVVTGHPHTHLFGFFFFFLCPAALYVLPFLAVRPASRRFSRGAFLGPARFLDSPWTF